MADRTGGAAAPLDVALQFSIDLEAVIAVARAAGDVILSIYDAVGPAADLQLEAKADSSPLTRADREANALICERLAQLAPHVPIVSEENRQVPYETRRGYQLCWCVDPLDGTKEFLKRNGQFTVNIALLRGDTPVFGVVHTPVQGRTHWAAHGRGAYVREPDGTESRLRAAAFCEADAGLSLVGSASHNTPETDDFIASYASPTFQALGSSLKMLLIAEGKAHIYPRLAPTSEWDTAAAHAIVAEAGGEILQAGACDSKGRLLEGQAGGWRGALAQHKPVVYNKPDPLNPFFVCYGRRLPPATVTAAGP